MRSIDELIGWFADAKSAMVALSGGVDSALVAYAAHASPNTRALAVTADYMTLAAEELQSAKSVAAQIGIRHHIIRYSELDDERFVQNNSDRCYHCRSQLGSRLNRLAASLGYDIVADGTNADDLADYRPGMRAIGEHGIQSPLKDLNATKPQIRRLARRAGLEVHDRPSNSCLASRIPWGNRITAEMLARVEMAERYVRNLMPTGRVRVRDIDGAARIEVDRMYVGRIRGHIPGLSKSFGLLGFSGITVHEYVMGGANK